MTSNTIDVMRFKNKWCCWYFSILCKLQFSKSCKCEGVYYENLLLYSSSLVYVKNKNFSQYL